MFKNVTKVLINSSIGLLLMIFFCEANADQYVDPHFKKIEVFADGVVDIPKINGVEIIAYDLNEITEINKPLHFAANTVDQSKAKLNQWLASDDYQAYMKQRRLVLQPLNLMAKYGVSKIPAIVFNEGEFAVYGTVDVNRSINDIQRMLEDVE